MSTTFVTPSYSQYGEDRYIAEVLARTPDSPKRLLDLGAWHPTVFSNSRALIEEGWEAVLVEPSPEPFLNLLREYGKSPKITLIQAALGIERRLEKMHATADAVSTTSDEVYRKWQQAGGYIGEFWTPAFTLADFFNQFDANFSFVNIDTEGSSVPLALEWLRTENRPRCFCVEHDERIVELSQAMQASGYVLAHLNGTNAVFGLKD